MEIVGYGFIIGCLVGLVLYFLDEYRMDKHYQNGYWAGRSAGWKASIEHQQKLRALKSRAVFDYDKSN
jgi:hypothetical protein